MSLVWWCTECWRELQGPRAVCSGCGFDPSADERDMTQRLAAELRHPLADRAVLAASLLGGRGDRRAVPALCDALSAADPYLQAEAAAALGHLGSDQAIPSLAELLREGALPGRVAAARALARLGGQVAEVALRRAAATDPSSTVVRIASRGTDAAQM
jgi:HEAT repeat protein